MKELVCSLLDGQTSGFAALRLHRSWMVQSELLSGGVRLAPSRLPSLSLSLSLCATCLAGAMGMHPIQLDGSKRRIRTTVVVLLVRYVSSFPFLSFLLFMLLLLILFLLLFLPLCHSISLFSVVAFASMADLCSDDSRDPPLSCR